MSEIWNYQIRIDLDPDMAAVARQDPDADKLKPLTEILEAHGAELVCQFDAFAGYVAEAEAEGPAEYPLYAWTKATIEDPVKEAKYKKSFTLYVGGAEVYAGDKAEPLEEDLRPLVGHGIVTDLKKYDTNPANNPHPPKP